MRCSKYLCNLNNWTTNKELREVKNRKNSQKKHWKGVYFYICYRWDGYGIFPVMLKFLKRCTPLYINSKKNLFREISSSKILAISIMAPLSILRKSLRSQSILILEQFLSLAKKSTSLKRTDIDNIYLEWLYQCKNSWTANLWELYKHCKRLIIFTPPPLPRLIFSDLISWLSILF